jgi:hypothetical protein
MSDPRLLSSPIATGASDSRGSEGKRSGFKSQAGNHDTVQDMKGELEDLVNMGDWELVGPMGSVAESVFKGKTLVEEEEVAIKVVSLNNSFLRDSKYVMSWLYSNFCILQNAHAIAQGLSRAASDKVRWAFWPAADRHGGINFQRQSDYGEQNDKPLVFQAHILLPRSVQQQLHVRDMSSPQLKAKRVTF